MTKTQKKSKRHKANNRQVRDPSKPGFHFYLHPTKGWKKEKAWTIQQKAKIEKDWKLFQAGLKAKDVK